MSHKKRAQDPLGQDVRDAVARLRCSTETARLMNCYCGERAIDIGIDLDFIRVAQEVWSRSRGSGAELVPLLDEFIAEVERHAHTMESLAKRFEIVQEHRSRELLPRELIDADRVHLALLPFTLAGKPRGSS